ncbi:hypothetical protein OIU34_24360 [Pararhizobium sp. BT-229]|uniref:hypothetical protein n=1 Tax=Pararhizobium sp. BT-229 TaxID=2986923 RepID=UPI0021F747E8|nr:hypothetical protein [Pararhizobium sp. BT-229]MCV9965034.1 hypothetical protein [Pararhizobium sp. BT-229]
MDIRDIAEHFYVSCCLDEDPSIDPDDALGVIDAAFLTSDCDDFAWVLARITGWPARTLIWNMGDCLTGHHSVVEAPDGRYLDVSGWTDRVAVAARAGKEERLVTAHEFRHYPFNFTELNGDEGFDMIVAVFGAVGREPFTEDWFKAAIERYLGGVGNVPPDSVDFAP